VGIRYERANKKPKRIRDIKNSISNSGVYLNSLILVDNYNWIFAERGEKFVATLESKRAYFCKHFVYDSFFL
jgi:hypothetical protein